jgi:hypothetical protein
MNPAGRSDSSESRSDLERFCQIVAWDDELHSSLLATTDEQRFAALAVELGQRHGCRFATGEVRAALEEKRRAWLQHWV